MQTQLSLTKNNFDFIRFCGAALVLISHSYSLYPTAAVGHFPENFITDAGFVAVASFFLISGFLITASYQRVTSIKNYFANRFLRIFPGLIGVTLFTVLIIGPLATTLPLKNYFIDRNIWQYLANITLYKIHYPLPGVFVHNPYPKAVNGSLWTLPYEFALYFLLPALSWLGFLSRKWLPLLLVILSIWLLKWADPTQKAFFGCLTPYFFADCTLYFFSGAALYIYRDHIPMQFSLLLCCLLAIIAAGHTASFSLVLHLAVPYLVFYLAFQPLGKLHKFGKWGDFSYGMYVFAFPIQQLLSLYFWPRLPFAAYMASSFLLTLALAIFSWHFIERPFLRLKKSKTSHPIAAPQPKDDKTAIVGEA